MTKLGEITVNGKPVSVFEKPHVEPDFPWVDVEELAKAFLPRSRARRIVALTHRFGEAEGQRACSTARNGDRIATIICHAMAQGLCGMIDVEAGHHVDELGPAHSGYSAAMGGFIFDKGLMSMEAMFAAFKNSGGPSMRAFREGKA
ncbi:hypothetical protein VW29_02740 [Devosia limi DSM 17137]|uniref:Uncharacterized protein n=1 Tax=Devosia limi DSM 17137 TaxID=1121477 RepID=A0A0F5LXV4_9HYPH|nr:hypothetical protein [Devosia limi]KKB86487.1 hypothetical protein VW29_02740 [Devosia limi DSM 17137]SHE87016.1 hypothetical protein SAMN02745223_01277 [Devosia limi DSM 17137]